MKEENYISKTLGKSKETDGVVGEVWDMYSHTLPVKW